jgi:hypothetical protein
MAVFMHLLMYVVAYGAMLVLLASILWLAGWLAITCWRAVSRGWKRDPAGRHDTPATHGEPIAAPRGEPGEVSDRQGNFRVLITPADAPGNSAPDSAPG